MPLSADDRLAIADLLARYCHTTDSGTPEQWASLFVAGGVFDGGERWGVARGRAELLAYAQRFGRGVRHFTSSPLIEGDGDTARVRLYLTSIAAGGPPAPRIAAEYTDTLRKVGGAWRFVERVVRRSQPGERPHTAAPRL